jgi:septal ring factor EnvC (AmiA/AmiB activator)
MALALGLVLATGADAQQGNVDRRIRENEERLATIRRERSQLEDELARLRSRAYTLESELQNLERQKNATNRIVNELDRQMRNLAEQLDTVTLDLILTQEAHAEKLAVLRRRLVEIYKRGPLWTVQVLLTADSFGALLSRYKYLYLVSRQDRALVNDVEELETHIGRQRQQLLAIHRELAHRRSERGNELDRYSELEGARQRSLRQAQSSQRVTASRLDSLARAEQELTNLLASLERERRRLLAAGAEAGMAAPAITERDLGTLDWPIEGDLLYRFGPAPGPDGTRIRYLGIGIRAPVNSAVRAVADGIVRTARHLQTWGQTVIIEHGGGFYTVYAHLSGVRVREDERVARGQQIGLSGGAGTEHGPHVEFQIRQGDDGNPLALDPLNWLKRRR